MNHVDANVVIMLRLHHPHPQMQHQRLMEHPENTTLLFFSGSGWILEAAIAGNVRDQPLICIACMLLQPTSTRSRCAATKEREAFLCSAMEALRNNPALVLVSFLLTVSRVNR